MSEEQLVGKKGIKESIFSSAQGILDSQETGFEFKTMWLREEVRRALPGLNENTLTQMISNFLIFQAKQGRVTRMNRGRYKLQRTEATGLLQVPSVDKGRAPTAEGPAEEQDDMPITPDAKIVLSHIPKNGAPISYNALGRKSGLDDASLGEALNILELVGLAKKGKGGGGGSITLTPLQTKINQLSPAAQKLFENIPLDGSFIGNTRLRQKLEVSIDSYFKLRQELEKKGLVKLGKGRGGSIARAERSVESLASDKLASLEDELWDPLVAWLEKNWGEEVTGRGDHLWVKKTAKLNRKGKWSTPDVTLVQLMSFDYLKEKVVELTTFEVKRFQEASDPKSLYEAAAHQRWAHSVYLVAEVPEKGTLLPEWLSGEANRFGVGLMTMYKSDGGNSYEVEEILPPGVHYPENEYLNEMLANFFEPEAKWKKEFMDVMK